MIKHLLLFWVVAAIYCCFSVAPSFAQNSAITNVVPLLPAGYLARIELNSPHDVELALKRAQVLFESGDVDPSLPPLAFVLHGPEVAIFMKKNYGRYKSIVDLAAQLSAFNVVDVRVCQTRLRALGEEPDALVPFVDSVPFGPAEIDRLLNDEKYSYF